MIKKLKIGLLIMVLSLAVGVGSAGAAAGDVVWSVNQTIDLSSPNMNLTIVAPSTASSIDVGTGTITPTLASGDIFTVSTESAGGLAVSPSTGVNITCSAGTVATVVITATGTQAYTITASATPCVYAGGSGGLNTGTTTYVPSGGTTSSVAQSSTPVTLTISSATPITPAVVMTTSTPGCSGGNKYNTSTGAVCVNNAVATNIPGCGNSTSGFSTATGVSCVGNVSNANASSSAHGPYSLGTVTLKNGSKGVAVMELQRLLNQVLNLGLVVDGKLGPKTIAVIKTWQKSHGLVSDGLVGAKTKAAMKLEAEK